MRKLLLRAACLLPLLVAGIGCQNSPHMINPLHWRDHFTKIFGWNEGEFHQFHLNVDRVIFGLDYFEQFEQSEPVYTQKS